MRDTSCRSLFLDQDEGSGRDLVEEIQDFLVEHFDAPRTAGLTDFFLVIGAVDVDQAVVAVTSRARIMAHFESAQPHESSGDQVFLLLLSVQFPILLSEAEAVAKHGSKRFAVTDFIGYDMETGWRTE